MKTVKLKNGTVIKVVYPEEVEFTLTQEDKEMDARACEAVRVAIEKQKFLENLKKNKI